MKYEILFIVFLTLFAFTKNSLAYGDNLEFEIIAPKEAGTGSPAIPATHRSFYAYPGIEYKIRAQVIGGNYPYVYELRDAPNGMTVNDDGYIRWANPQSSASNITLRVTDRDGDYIESRWSISVQTSGFKFVDDVETNGNGSVDSPYNSIENMCAGASSADIIYFRSGTYAVPTRGDYTFAGRDAIGFEWSDPTPIASRWLAYPGEEATIDFQNTHMFYGAPSLAFYFEGLTFYRARSYVFRAASGLNYVTFLDCIFDTATTDEITDNRNMGAYFTMWSGEGYYLTFQGCTFTNFNGVQSIGSLYNQTKFLIEDNIFTNFVGTAATNQILALKVGLQKMTLRGNTIVVSDSSMGPFGSSSLNSGLTDGTAEGFGGRSTELEICYNKIVSTVSSSMRLNSAGDIGTVWFYRNTLQDMRLEIIKLDQDSCEGPYYFENNVFQNNNSGIDFSHYSNGTNPSSCVSQNQNLTCDTDTENDLVDANGLLINRSNVGTYGWEIAEDEYWSEGGGDVTAPSTPSGLSVS